MSLQLAEAVQVEHQAAVVVVEPYSKDGLHHQQQLQLGQAMVIH